MGGNQQGGDGKDDKDKKVLFTISTTVTYMSRVAAMFDQLC
jgi:hypothetical protein